MQARRLDQILANCGYCSRSEAKVWVRKGRVTVAGASRNMASLHQCEVGPTGPDEGVVRARLDEAEQNASLD